MITEREFQLQVMELAYIRGWSTFHVRAGRTLDSWRTPGSGTMAKGWPDCVFVRGSRIIFVELKRDGGKPTADQRRVLDVLSKAAEAYVWEPKDWDFLSEELR